MRRLLVAGSTIAVLVGCGGRTGLAGFDGAGPNPGMGGTNTGGANGGTGGASGGTGGASGGDGVVSSGGSIATGGLGGAGGFPSGGSPSGGSGGTPPQVSYLDYFKSSDPEVEEYFGAKVALSADGRTLAVGAPRDDSAAVGINGDPQNDDLPASGAVYVYFRQDDIWTLQAYIKASNPDVEDSFGWALALSDSGDHLAVGAIGEDSSAVGVDGDSDDNSALDSGAAYVFSRSGDSWTQDAYVKATNTEGSDNFGSAVALSADGSTLVVGASAESSGATGAQGDQADNTAIYSGAVYVLVQTGSGWTHQAYLKASNTDPYDAFGASVALSDDGNLLVVGAIYEASSSTGLNGIQDDEGAPGAGAIYVLERSGSSWSQTDYVKATNTDANDVFGFAVDISGPGTTIAIGALSESSLASGINGDPQDDSGSFVGAVYVLERTGLVWAHDAYVKASNPQSASFGCSLALSADGTALLVGAGAESSGATGIDGDQSDQSAPGAGAAYLFRRSPPAWEQTAYLKAHNTASYASFGYTVALDASAALAAIGAPVENGSSPGINGDPTDFTTASAGAAYVYPFD